MKTEKLCSVHNCQGKPLVSLTCSITSHGMLLGGEITAFKGSLMIFSVKHEKKCIKALSCTIPFLQMVKTGAKNRIAYISWKAPTIII